MLPRFQPGDGGLRQAEEAAEGGLAGPVLGSVRDQAEGDGAGRGEALREIGWEARPLAAEVGDA